MAMPGTDLYQWLRRQDLINDPAWQELRRQYGGNSTNEEWVQHVVTHPIEFTKAYDMLPAQFKGVQRPLQPPPPPRRVQPALQQMTAQVVEAKPTPAEVDDSTQSNRLVRLGRAIKQKNLWLLVLFVFAIFLFFSYFDWQTSRYGVFVGANIDTSTELGGLLKTVGEMIVLVMIFAESFLQVLHRLSTMMGVGNVFQIQNKTIRVWMLVGYAIMITLLLSNYWFSFVPVTQLYGPVIGICLALLPTVFQVVLFEVILGYLFSSLDD